MKTLLLSTTFAALAMGAMPADPGRAEAATILAAAHGLQALGHGVDEFDRRGRGGRDGGHGGRPRVPGGSGCDDSHDVIEHPECRLR